MAGGRLLILDDDETVGQILLMAAQAAGCEARACTSFAAFEVALPQLRPTHVAIDLTLPDTTPPQVLALLAEAAPRARVIVCSGAGGAELEAALAEARRLGLPVAGALGKPFRLAALRALLADPD